MAIDGSFISEVFCDGRTFHFEAAFTARRWSATIWDEQGRPRGSIGCACTAPSLEGDALEDAVCEWVHRSVRHQVGVVLDPECSVRAVNLCDAPGEAANAELYGHEERAEDPWRLWDMVDALAAKSRKALLHTRTGIAPAGFLIAAHAARQESCDSDDSDDTDDTDDTDEAPATRTSAAKAIPLCASSQAAFRPPA